MTEKLRTALQEAAEQSRPVQIPDHLWSDARRARRRDQVLVTLVAAVVFVGVGAGVSWLVQPRHEAIPSDGGDSGNGAGIPSHLYNVSSARWTAVGYSGMPGLSERLDVGQASALLAIGAPDAKQARQIVLVRAEDGAYVRTTLPGTPATFDEHTMPRLSQSGTYVAWPTTSRTGQSRPELGGPAVRVLNLTTGECRDYWVGGRADEVTDVTWSASSTWLAFRLVGPSGASTGTIELTSGRVQVGAGLGDTAGSLGVGDDGRQYAVNLSELNVWRKGEPARHLTLPGGYSPGDLIAVDGERVALGGTDKLMVGESSPASYVPIALADRGHVVPLRWLDADHVLVLTVEPADLTLPELGVVSVPDASYRKVGQVDSPLPAQVSFATGLATVDHPTVHRAAPQWLDDGGWSWSRTFWVFVLLGLITFGLGRLGGRVSGRVRLGHHTSAAQAEAATRAGVWGSMGGRF